jgi:pilus assembly protein CpaB
MKLPTLSNIRPNKTWAVLGVSLVIGLGAALVARSYLFGRMAEIEASAKGRTIGVVVAKKDLPKGARVTGDTAAVRMIPVMYAHSTAVSPEEFERIDGQTLAFPVKSGEMILWGLLEGKKAPTFSARVAEGHRAMTVPVDEINSISGMLEPGDSIDLVVTLDQKGKKLTFPLLQAVPVMATGQRSMDDPKTGERRSYTTVTLDTTPDAAQNVIVAREIGKITALLRNPNDKQPLANGQADIATLLGGKGGDEDGKVPILYGGKGSKGLDDGLKMGPGNAQADAAPMLSLRAASTAGEVQQAQNPVPVLTPNYPRKE